MRGVNPMWICAVAVAVAGGCIDWQTRRLPNWLTVAGCTLGLAGNAWLFGWSGIWAAMIGAGIPLLLLLPVVLLRGLGAGDWKLMGALGAMVSSRGIIQLLVVTIVIAGAIAAVNMIQKRRVRVTLRNLFELVRGFFVFGLRPHPEMRIDNPGGLTIPFGVAAALGTVLCYVGVLRGF